MVPLSAGEGYGAPKEVEAGGLGSSKSSRGRAGGVCRRVCLKREGLSSWVLEAGGWLEEKGTGGLGAQKRDTGSGILCPLRREGLEVRILMFSEERS